MKSQYNFFLVLLLLRLRVKSNCDFSCVCTDYFVDEDKNDLGPGRCVTDCECDGTRRCHNGFCHECRNLNNCPINVEGDLPVTLISKDAAMNLEKFVKNVDKTMPSNYNKYVSYISLNVKLSSDFFHIDELKEKLSKSPVFIPAEQKEKFERLIYLNSLDYQLIDYTTSFQEGVLIEFIGIGRKKNEKVEIAFLHLYAYGDLIEQSTVIKKKVCETVFFFFEDCEYVRVSETRGFTASELEVIQQSLRAKGYAEAEYKLKETMWDD